MPQWRDVVKEWMGAIAVGGRGRLCIFPKLATKKPLVVQLQEVSEFRDCSLLWALTECLSPQADAKIENVAWAINSNEPLKPLIVFTVTSVILVYDVQSRKIVGKLRGHGGVGCPISMVAIQ